MALQAGSITVTVEFAKGLVNKDWFGKQDPYCVLTVGTQKVRSRTHIDGGKNPVWNQTFSFTLVNENSIHLALYDEDTLSNDDLIGIANISCAKVREQGRDHIQVPVITTGNKQRGFVSLSLTFSPIRSLKVQQVVAGLPRSPSLMPQPQHQTGLLLSDMQAPQYAPVQPSHPQQAPYPNAAQPYPQQPYVQQAYPQQAYPQQAYPQQPYPQQPYPQQPYPQALGVYLCGNHVPPPYPLQYPQQPPLQGLYPPQAYSQAPNPYGGHH